MTREVASLRIDRETLPTRRGLFVSGLLSLASCATASCAIEAPEAAVSCALQASLAEDREAYAACFTPRSRAFLGAFWGAVGETRPDLLPRGGEGLVVQEVRPLHDPDADAARALVVLSEGGPDRTLRVVLHELGGRWRIDLWDTAGAQFGLRGM